LREKVLFEDLLQARRRFSDSRLKDLCDEYSDNYPQLQLVLGRFFGLGSEFTVKAIEDFVKKLLVDEEIKKSCAGWIYTYTQPDLLIQLFFNIGFAGIKDNTATYFRSLGSQSTTPPAIDAKTIVVIHPTYREALNLREVLLTNLDPLTPLSEGGLLPELPQGITIDQYNSRLLVLRDELKTMPEGEAHANEFADLAGEALRLCLFKSLTNFESKVRSVDGRVIRDWIAANHSPDGFWEVIRQKHGATQIVFECKNYSELGASDFHQVAYYMNGMIGRFAVLIYRGDQIKRHYYEHIRRIASDKRGMVLLLTDRDTDILLRHAINGKSSEAHLQELYDRTVREVS
jgi:hypothetical protein